MSNASEDTEWNVVGTGILMIVAAALMLMFLPLNGVRVLGILIILIVGLGLTVAGAKSKTPPPTEGKRKAE